MVLTIVPTPGSMASAARRADASERAAEGYRTAARALWAAYEDELKPSDMAWAISKIAHASEREATSAIAEATAIRAALASPELAAGKAVEVTLD